MSNAVAVIPFNDIERMASAVAKSNLFGVKNQDQAIALMLVAQAEGRHPALAARDYDIIQGRPSKKAEAMLRDFLESGGSVEWHQLDDALADATFSHPAGGKVRIEWTMKRAIAAGLGGRDMWKKYPRQMLRSRVVSEGIRTVCPMATSGMYIPEEVSDMVREKDITPTAGAGDNLTQERKGQLTELADKVRDWIVKDCIGDAVLEIDNAALEADEKTYLWTMFDSKERSAMKKEVKRQRDEATEKAKAKAIENHNAAEQALISDAQKRRLEARIVELGLDRENVKFECHEKYGVNHFQELTVSQYKELDKKFDDMDVASQI